MMIQNEKRVLKFRFYLSEESKEKVNNPYKVKFGLLASKRSIKYGLLASREVLNDD